MKVLVAEDEASIREGLSEILESEGYQVLQAVDGAQALELFKQHAPDFICLDVMMPEQSGFDVCKQIRAIDADVPIIFITAKSEEIDKVVGFELGADDYIAKPFGVREVVARIRAITRRCLKRSPERASLENFVFARFDVDPRQLTATAEGEVIELSLREVSLLSVFARNEGMNLDRDTLLNECWGVDYMPSSRTLDQHVAKLRKKVERDPKAPKYILTVHGVGYRYAGVSDLE